MLWQSGVITDAGITMFTLSLCITSGGPLFKCCHSCISCPRLLCCDMPTITNWTWSSKWTNLKIMSGYLVCVEQINLTPWNDLTEAVDFIGIIQDWGRQKCPISTKVDDCKRLWDLNIMQRNVYVLVWMATLLFQLANWWNNMPLHTFSVSQSPGITTALLWLEEADLCRTERISYAYPVLKSLLIPPPPVEMSVFSPI